MEFKDELKAFRKANGLTQMELAKKLGTSFATVNRLEKGHFKPSYSFLSKFAALQEEMKTKVPMALNKDLASDVSMIIEKAKGEAYRSVNLALLQRNYLIGKAIHEEALKSGNGEESAFPIIKALSKRLEERYGKGHETKELLHCLSFYEAYPNIFQTPFGQSFLSWPHYLVLLQVGEGKAREWYEQEARSHSWDVATLQKKVSSQYYYLCLKSKKAHIEDETSQRKENPSVASDPSILGFLGIPENNESRETGLEGYLIESLKKYLLDSGRGFGFLARQKRIHTEKEDYLIDLVFYNYILKRFVLFDVKEGKLTHQDIGQMDMYVRMYDEREKQPGDNPTIGILLCSEEDKDVVHYSNLSESDQLFATKHKSCLPSEEELKEEMERQKAFFRLR